MKILEKNLGKDHPDTAEVLTSLAEMYSAIGDYAVAEPLFQRALKIREAKLGPEHPYTELSLYGLAKLYHSRGDYSRAEPLYQRVLKISEKNFGPDHFDAVSGIGALAALCQDVGDYVQAERLFLRALKIYERVLGPEHRHTAIGLSNLAVLYNVTGEYVRAEPLYLRALKILGKVLGPEHPYTSKVFDNLALLQIDLRRSAEALLSGIRSAQAGDKVLGNFLSFTSEQQRLAYQAAASPYTIFATLGSAPHVAQAILRRKGIVLDSLLEDMQLAHVAGDPVMGNTIVEIRSLKAQLCEITMDVPRDTSEQGLQRLAERRTMLERRAEALESIVARRIAGLGQARRILSVTPTQVQAVLPQDAVAVEYVRYAHYLGRGRFENRYGAVILRSTGAPSWVCLGEAKSIEELVGRYRVEVRRNSTANDEQEERLAELLRALDKHLWEPVETHLPKTTRRVMLSPDGALNFVAFATLLGPDKSFLAERYRIDYVASGRDLLKGVGDPRKTSVAVFADPDFSANALAGVPADGMRGTNFRLASAASPSDLAFPKLEGSAMEAMAITELGRKAGWTLVTHTRGTATKAQLIALPAPRLLHLATHGFFLPVDNNGTTSTAPPGLIGTDTMSGRKPKNPMYYSGLALAGAQTTVNAWRRGEAVPSERDGILTSAEISQLDLNGTQLVVLSACDTGMGTVVAGEGVLGLRRAFVQAGARNLLLTLWPVQDQSTAAFMKEFYQHLVDGAEPPAALAATQREWLVRVRKQKGLRQAVVEAGPFIMSIQGKP